MTTPTLPELRRILGQAMLAAPLLVACSKAPPRQERTEPRPDAPAVAVKPDAAPRPPDAAAKKAVCDHEPLNVSSCGGGEAMLKEPLDACGLTASRDPLPRDVCDAYCGTFDYSDCNAFEGRDGKPGIFCRAANPCRGRMPSTGTLAGATHDDQIADHLAVSRRMEALSVDAFRELEADLARWGAPAALLAACRRAADEEARHADAMTRLLDARGVAPEPLDRAPAAGFASLLALALHNEREGAVGETWGALLARHQAAHADDADLRAAMESIAAEEEEHAALAFAIGAWARQVLDADGVRALDDARRDAFAALRAELEGMPAAAGLGLPDPARSAAMLDALAVALA